MQQKKRSVAANSKQVRGPQLHDQMVKSETYGDEYRKKHQGQDMLDTRVQHQTNKTDKIKK